MIGKCQNPNCDNEASEKYSGQYNNSVKVCEKHYYRLVIGGSDEVGGTTTAPTPHFACGSAGSESLRIDSGVSKGPEIDPNAGGCDDGGLDFR